MTALEKLSKTSKREFRVNDIVELTGMTNFGVLHAIQRKTLKARRVKTLPTGRKLGSRGTYIVSRGDLRTWLEERG